MTLGNAAYTNLPPITKQPPPHLSLSFPDWTKSVSTSSRRTSSLSDFYTLLYRRELTRWIPARSHGVARTREHKPRCRRGVQTDVRTDVGSIRWQRGCGGGGAVGAFKGWASTHSKRNGGSGGLVKKDGDPWKRCAVATAGPSSSGPGESFAWWGRDECSVSFPRAFPLCNLAGCVLVSRCTVSSFFPVFSPLYFQLFNQVSLFSLDLRLVSLPRWPPPPRPFPLRAILFVPLAGRPSLRIPVPRRSSSPSRLPTVDLGSFHVSLLLSPQTDSSYLSRPPPLTRSRSRAAGSPAKTSIRQSPVAPWYTDQARTSHRVALAAGVTWPLSSASPRHTRPRRVTC